MTTKQRAANLRRTVALKGQSRSKFCAEPVKRGVPCQRLSGHKGDHREFTTRAARRAAKTASKVTIVAEASADRKVAAPAPRAKRRNSGQPTVPNGKPSRSKVG